MLKMVVLAAVIVLLGAGPAAAQVFEAEGRYWFTDLEGSAKIDNGVDGTRFDFEDDLDLDAEGLPELRVSLGLGNARFRLAYATATFEGDGTLSQTIVFEGRTFTAGTRVESEFELHYARFAWIWTPTIIPGVLRAGPMFELKGFLADVSLESPGVREAAEVPLVLPTIGVATDVSVGPVQVFGEVSGLPAGDYGYLVDGEAGVRVMPLPLLALSAGYRIFDARAGDDDDYARLRLTGPFVNLALRF
jgi:hypothetical protein